MCTGFVSFGKDYLAGFNLDADPAVYYITGDAPETVKSHSLQN